MERLHCYEINSDKPPILFIHGICHGAWCWGNFIKYFNGAGYSCYALDFRGHGVDRANLSNKLTMDDYKDDTIEAIDEIVRRTDKKPVLVGHSMGGGVAQKVAGEYEDKLSGLVLFASATAPKMNMRDLFRTFCHRDLLRALLFSLGRKVKLEKSAFFTAYHKPHSVDKDEMIVAKEKLQPESTMVTRKNLFHEYSTNYSMNIPVFAIGSDADAYFPEKSLQQTYDQYKNNGSKVELKILSGICHDMMLDAEAETVAGEVMSWIARNCPLLQ